METVHFLLTIFSILMNTGKEEPLYTIVMISLVQFRFISCGLRLALPTIFAKEYLHVSFCLHSFALYANRCFEFCAVPFYFITFEHVTLNFQASRILSISSNLLLLTGWRLRNSQVFYFFFLWLFSFDSIFFSPLGKKFQKSIFTIHLSIEQGRICLESLDEFPSLSKNIDSPVAGSENSSKVLTSIRR